MRIYKGTFGGETFFTIGGVQLLERDLWENLYNQKYIVNSRGVYQIFYSQAQQAFYGLKVVDKPGLARRGRYYAMTGSQVNHLLGAEILNDF